MEFDPLGDGISKVVLIDSMGTDDTIVNCARTSYGKGTRSVRDNKGLIRYLLRHYHTSPFEFVEFIFFIKCPIFVSRQIVRHRTAVINEYSQRYSEVLDEFYSPKTFYEQDSKNRQGSTEELGLLEQYIARSIVNDINRKAYQSYQSLLKNGVSREDARMVLPLSTYTQFYWKMDLNNLFKFLKLRMDAHTQHETRKFAEAIGSCVAETVPIAWEAFEEYLLYAQSFNRTEVAELGSMFESMEVPNLNLDFFNDEPSEKTLEQRKNEFYGKMGLI